MSMGMAVRMVAFRAPPMARTCVLESRALSVLVVVEDMARNSASLSLLDEVMQLLVVLVPVRVESEPARLPVLRWSLRAMWPYMVTIATVRVINMMMSMMIFTTPAHGALCGMLSCLKCLCPSNTWFCFPLLPACDWAVVCQNTTFVVFIRRLMVMFMVQIKLAIVVPRCRLVPACYRMSRLMLLDIRRFVITGLVVRALLRKSLASVMSVL